MKANLRVVDFFCGAGGFSEGFRQQGFNVVMGIDNWNPAVITHNINHDLEDKVTDILIFENCDVSKIDEQIKDSEVIVGSPPCVSFSMSNNAGKADKTLGIRLILSYLRIVAYKKFKKNSVLKAWYMENVPNSRNYVAEKYSFEDLELSDFAKSIGKNPKDIAIKVKNNGTVLTAADYGSPQKRQRFVCGEFVETGEFLNPKKTHEGEPVSLGSILGKMPKPNETAKKVWADPNYSQLKLTSDKISDHYYDTGVFETEWRESKYLKENHPFMGKMSFPENNTKPSRTIMATRSASTREAIIYKSETKRIGNGEYRLPTIREVSTLMGFPYCYQFSGSEGTKWRLIGNAVCPHMSFALALAIKEKMGLSTIKHSGIAFDNQLDSINKVNNLNDNFTEKDFSKPPKKKSDSVFRKHPIKGGNITVNLTNYDPTVDKKKQKIGKNWIASINIGSGKNYDINIIDSTLIDTVEKIVKSNCEDFIKRFETEILPNVGDSLSLQARYSENNLCDTNPLSIVDTIASLINSYKEKDTIIDTSDLLPKKELPLGQLMAILAIGICVETSRGKVISKI